MTATVEMDSHIHMDIRALWQLFAYFPYFIYLLTQEADIFRFFPAITGV